MTDQIKVNKFTKEIKKKRRLNAKKLDREEEFKNRHDILEAGQEDHKKGVKAVIEQEKENKKEKDKLDADALTDLEQKRKQRYSYRASLAQSLSQLLENLDWIYGWQAYCVPTDGSPIQIKGKGFSTKEGLMMIVTTPDGRVFHQGILTTHDPVLDYSALYTLAATVENTMDKERGLLLDKKDPIDDNILDQYGKPVKSN